MKVVAGFHTRDDHWILPRKLRSLEFCDRVIVLLDRPSKKTIEICSGFENVETHFYQNLYEIDRASGDGVACEEGRMRQVTWDLMARHNPDWCLLGDTDEIFTPDIQDFLFDQFLHRTKPPVEVFYCHWVNLYESSKRHISGLKCVWSYQHPQSNKKGVIVRFDQEKQRAGLYKYDLRRTEHTRMEPSPISVSKAVITETRKLVETPKLIHWKFARLDHWRASPQAQLEKYKRFWEGLELSDTPEEWIQ